MVEDQWQILGEIEAGDVWVGVAEHPRIERVDRTHCGTRTTLGFWMSSHQNASRGRFLANEWPGGHERLGKVVVIPGGIPLHVRSSALPERRMLHLRLPERLRWRSGTVLLDSCLDVRSEVIARSLSRLALEVLRPGFGTRAITEGLGLLVFGELERLLAGRSAPEQRRGGLAPWQLKRIDDHLRAGNWNSSVSEIADLCGVSPGHAMRAFRQSTGVSIAGHIASLRIDHACTLLSRDAHSVAAIANDLRFASPSAFAAAFRRALGVSPNSYRQHKRSSSAS